MFSWVSANAAGVQATAITISAMVAIAVMLYTRRVNRRRATLDMVMKSFLDEGGRVRYQRFIQVVARDRDKNDPFTIESLYSRTEENAEERGIVIHQLNEYELVSLGVRRKLFDGHFYKHWFHTQFTSDFKSVEPLLRKVQGDKPSCYSEFCGLYTTWNKSGHPVNNPNRFKLAWWGITKNHKKLKAAESPEDC